MRFARSAGAAGVPGVGGSAGALGAGALVGSEVAGGLGAGFGAGTIHQMSRHQSSTHGMPVDHELSDGEGAGTCGAASAGHVPDSTRAVAVTAIDNRRARVRDGCVGRGVMDVLFLGFAGRCAT
ncbi:MAG: hypothetical protein ACRCZD_05490 [Phycicoccus sp.]